jgi:hypothetical protein
MQRCIQFYVMSHSESWLVGRGTTANVFVRFRFWGDKGVFPAGLWGWVIMCVLYSCSLVLLLHQASSLLTRLVSGGVRNKRS